MTIAKPVAVLFVFLALMTVVVFSFSSSFYGHLRVDIYGQYVAHAKSFAEYHDVAHIGYNEYQPVAVMFFALLSPGLHAQSDPIVGYIYTLYAVNAALILLIAYLIYAYTKNYTNVFLYSLVILAVGPIVLHRFELLVFTLILACIMLFSRKRYVASGVLLGVSVLTKIYPIIFAPYFFYVLYKNKQAKRSIVQFAIGCLLGAAGVLFLYCVVLGADAYKIYTDFYIHALKPVHVESVWASLITLYHWAINGAATPGVGAYGIFGIKESAIIAPKWVFNYLWILFVGALYALIVLRRRSRRPMPFDTDMLCLIVLGFLITSKILCGQYILWLALPFCLQSIPGARDAQGYFPQRVFGVLAVGVLTQFIYPLNYDSFLDFYRQGTHEGLFLIVYARNTLLCMLLVTYIADLLGSTRAIARHKDL